jgi:hypothetical protein
MENKNEIGLDQFLSMLQSDGVNKQNINPENSMLNRLIQLNENQPMEQVENPGLERLRQLNNADNITQKPGHDLSRLIELNKQFSYYDKYNKPVKFKKF